MTDHRIDLPAFAIGIRDDLLGRLSQVQVDVESVIAMSGQERQFDGQVVVGRTRAATDDLRAALSAWCVAIQGAAQEPAWDGGR